MKPECRECEEKKISKLVVMRGEILCKECIECAGFEGEQTPLSSSALLAGSATEVTENMLHAAMKKAVELGVLSEFAHQDEYIRNFDRMRQVLNSALLEA